jgi:hypothetical protein
LTLHNGWGFKINHASWWTFSSCLHNWLNIMSFLLLTIWRCFRPDSILQNYTSECLYMWVNEHWTVNLNHVSCWKFSACSSMQAIIKGLKASKRGCGKYLVWLSCHSSMDGHLSWYDHSYKGARYTWILVSDNTIYMWWSSVCRELTKWHVVRIIIVRGMR